MILAGDIGGTNTRLAFFEGTPDKLTASVIEVFPSGEHDGPAAIAKKTEEGRDMLADSGKEVLDRGKELFDRGRELADEAADIFERGRKLVRG